MKTQRARGAFTVFELLAVILIIGLLGFIFLPIWASARADTHNATCIENLRQIGNSVALYAGDNHGRFPGTQHEPPSWADSLANYSSYSSAGRFVCGKLEVFNGKPVRWTYALNDFLTPHPYGARELDFSRWAAVPSPSETMIFAEAAEEYRRYDHFHFADAIDHGFSVEPFADQVDIERHDTAANYLFVDGRVEPLDWSTGARPKLKFPRSKFAHPAGGTSGPPQIARR